MPRYPNDARLWAELSGLFYDAGATSPEDRGRFARRAVAIVRRERATTPARTFAPGDKIPYDVTRVYDLDGAAWTRQGEPPDTLKDTWKMPGFNRAEHEWGAGGAWVTPALLDEYGPLTEIPQRDRTGKEHDDDRPGFTITAHYRTSQGYNACVRATVYTEADRDAAERKMAKARRPYPATRLEVRRLQPARQPGAARGQRERVQQAPESPADEKAKVMEQISKRLFNWASILEPNTREQAERASTMPFIWPHLALMPDAHLGKGATVGSVIPTLGAIMPAAVGVDIGCGMLSVRTELTAADLDGMDLSVLREAIEHAVPLSAGKYNESVFDGDTENRIADLAAREGADSADAIAPNWRLQLGSLGSGNHFIEVSLDELDRVWLFLHSGSRGVGNKLAVKHIKIAYEQCQRRWIELPDPDLAYLVEGEPEFWEYLRDLRWAQHFALLNRAEMMDRVIWCLAGFVRSDIVAAETIQCHHNYTEQMTGDLLGKWKRPKGRSGHVWLSRKGAIDASPGRPGLIPGSMGTASYVVTGLGDPLSLNSSPHGAGREHSRTQARKTFTREQLDTAMEGIEWGRSDAFLDEIPGAYKPVDVVMADAADLVKIEHTLRQIVNVKGD